MAAAYAEKTARADLMGILDFFGGGSNNSQPTEDPSFAALRELGLPQGLLDAYQKEQDQNRRMQAMQMVIGGLGNAVSSYQGMAPVAAPSLGVSNGGAGGLSGIDGLVDRAMKFSQLRAQIQGQQNLVELRKAIASDPNLTPQQRQTFMARPDLYDDVIKAQVTDKGPAEVQIYNRIANEMKQQGKTPPSLEQWLPEYRRSGQQNINVNTGKSLAEGLVSDFVGGLPKAQALATDIGAIHSARDALESGIFTGQTANINQEIGKFGSLIGINDPRVQNTELFLQATASRVLPIVKNLGSGSGITDADRMFAEKLAAGNVKFEQGTLERLLDISERANRAAIMQHNQQAKSILEANPDLAKAGLSQRLFVQEPEGYKTRAQRAQEELDRRRAASRITAGGTP